MSDLLYCVQLEKPQFREVITDVDDTLARCGRIHSEVIADPRGARCRYSE